MEQDYADSRRQMLERNGFGMSQTSGRSMRPLIWGGEHCVVVAPLEGEPKVGDLLMFVGVINGGRGNIVHRLVEIHGKGDRRIYVTRGDNCAGCERVSKGDRFEVTLPPEAAFGHRSDD